MYKYTEYSDLCIPECSATLCDGCGTYFYLSQEQNSDVEKKSGIITAFRIFSPTRTDR